MDFRRLRYFTAIAEQCSISKAANHLRISQPALSRQLRLLEEELGHALLIRHGQGVTLTETGAKLLEQCEVVFEALDNARRAISESVDDKTPRNIVVGLNGSPSRFLCPLLVGEFCTSHPHLSLEFSVASSEALQSQILDGEVDVAILSNPPPDRNLIITPLLLEDVHMIRALDDKVDGSPLSIDDFAELQFTTTAYMKADADTAINALFEQAGLPKRQPVVINSVPMTREVLLNRIGFCVGPPSNYGPELLSGDLVSMPVPGLNVTRALAVRREYVVLSAFVELEQFLRDKTRQLIADHTWPAASLQEAHEI
ncbi:MAG: LysR family transcriptional regulator [Alphaproteobacteria bacterium]